MFLSIWFSFSFFLGYMRPLCYAKPCIKSSLSWFQTLSIPLLSLLVSYSWPELTPTTDTFLKWLSLKSLRFYTTIVTCEKK